MSSSKPGAGQDALLRDLDRSCPVRKLVEFPKGFRHWSSVARVSAMAAVFSFASAGVAQQALYPLKEGIQQPFSSSDIPSWIKLDFELRGRTDDMSAQGLVPGKDRAYEETRVWGGMTVTPTKWLTGMGSSWTHMRWVFRWRTRRRICVTPST